VSVTAPKGFVAVGGSAGIKAEGVPDVAVVATADGQPVPTAAVFTANRAAAAPVQVSRDHMSSTAGQIAAVVLTSGNANAATGAPGVAASRALCQAVATELDSEPEHVLICQTGLIGIPFPIDVALPQIAGIVAQRAADASSGESAARAIMTTDTVPKTHLAVGDGFTVGGMAKGAAMLAPNMATMLALVTTDAQCDAGTLAQVLAEAVAVSFNDMTVDGCTSTNDTVILMASGQGSQPSRAALAAAVTEVCSSLAAQMVDDAEGATKVAHIVVTGATSDAAAHQAARKVADSLLVKCSLNGEDPYWGRVASELGSAGVAFEMDLLSIAYGGTIVCAGGVAAPHDAAAVSAYMAGRHIEIVSDLGLGDGKAVVLSTDLGYGYIDENRTTS
jgi:glutamate N-acetyltransferase / amino-acid N-acetyltransferase